MILKIYNNKVTYSFDVVDLNDGEKMFYKFQIPTIEMEDGKYNLVLFDDDENTIVEDILVIGDFNSNSLQYMRGDNVYIETKLDTKIENTLNITITEIDSKIVPSDGYDCLKEVNINAQPIYDNGFSNGYNDGVAIGVENQKNKLESITITENGTYSKEDGYNNVIVEVPDLNGSYDDGYNDGIEEGLNNADGIIAETAQVLNITENGVYLTKYEEPIIPEITSYFDDGTPFYSYAQFYKEGVYKDNITIDKNTEVEIWWKGDVNQNDKFIFGCGSYLSFVLKIINGGFETFLLKNGDSIRYSNAQSDVWYHFKLSFKNGFWVNGEKVGDFVKDFSEVYNILVLNSNTKSVLFGDYCNNGCYGMLKINNEIYIPTGKGYMNYNDNNEILPTVVEFLTTDSTYDFFNEKPIYAEGNLIKRVNVDVPLKLKNGMKLAYSSFNNVDDIDFSDVTDFSNMFNSCEKLQYFPTVDTSEVFNMANMFSNCTNLKEIQHLNTSKVINMDSMFASCKNLTTIPQIDTSNVEVLAGFVGECSNLTTFPQINTSKVTSMDYMFANCKILTEVPQLNTSNVKTMANMFQGCVKLKRIPPIDTSKVTNVSHWLYSFSANYDLEELPKLDFGNVTKIGNMFTNYTTNFPNLTTCGGFENLKINWTDNYGLRCLPNLSYQSCINILNGLYDFVGNGEQKSAALKVNQNFLDTVGDDISIGTSKGWQITN